MPFRTGGSRLSAKLSSADARKTVIEKHRRMSSHLDRARCRACHLKTILEQLNETFVETRSYHLLPYFTFYDEMDRMLRQAVTVYEQLRLEESCSDDDATTSRPVAAAASDDDDLGQKFDDHVGLARRVRDQCRQYSDVLQLALHRETIYQVMSLKELKSDLASVEKQLSKYQAEGDRDEKKLRKMAKAYRSSRRQFRCFRYFRLKWMICDAIDELRME